MSSQDEAFEFITGAEAIVRGALDAGCDFFAGYPITPATTILQEMMQALPARGGVAIQAEDEIAALGMCIGASLSGARPLTATSGPGMSLYSENIGAALMLEAPLVIVDCQRMGPATGGATTTAQGDVQFLRWGTSGGWPLIVLAPVDAADAYVLTWRAFDLAWELRLPVIIATEKETVLSRVTVPARWLTSPAQRAEPLPPPKPPFHLFDAQSFERVAPLFPLGGDTLARYTTSSHDEHGYLVKERRVFEALNRHLWEKVRSQEARLSMVEVEGDAQAEVLLVGYGVTALAVRQALSFARSEGWRVSALILRSLWPVPQTAIRQALQGVRRVVVAELNLGLYRREIERLADRSQEVVGVHRLDGELISPLEILEAAGWK